MSMKNPPHPGGFVLRQCIEPLGLSITGAAAALGVTRTTLSELVNGKRGISPEMAVRISKVFGGSAESWLTQQAHYDLAQVRADRIKLKRLQPALARTALKDDFRRKLLGRRGRIPKDIDLEF
jgi:addiction module HigA family antidote